MENFLNILKNIYELEQFQAILKLVLISLLAGILGQERESWKKPAGFRTYMLVGISSVLVVLSGEYLHNKFGADASRIPAQLVSGIGFLGAGTILRDGFHVKGLTTAAGLLSIACIGLIVGSGYYLIAIIATCIAYCILAYSHFLSNTMRDFNTLNLKITSGEAKEIFDNIKNILNSEKLEIMKIKIIDDEYIRLVVRSAEKIDKNKLFTKILKIESVNGISEIEE